MRNAIEIGGTTVRPGERKRLEIRVARLPTETWVSLPAEVVSGSKAGPRLWLSAAVHGDELNGVEIIRQVLAKIEPTTLRGHLIAVPIVNVFGFINQSRYLPDRRDLNRSFPGSPKGSLASRLAHLFMTEVVTKCTHGIDLHTGSNYRTNLPQVRANLEDAETRQCAETFAAPAMINSQIRDGSLRQAAAKLGKPVLLYEAGEPLRFDNHSIKLGVEGVLRVMAGLEMLKVAKKSKRPATVEISHSRWVRARRSGIVRLHVRLGDHVQARQELASISDAFGDDRVSVRAPFGGLIIGHSNNPLAHQGDAILHVAEAAKGPLGRS